VTFAWDPKKALANFRKHRVDFREAATVFADPLSVTFPDEEHSVSERRFLIVGASVRNRVLVVSHVEVEGGIRIISARTATQRERTFYEEDEPEPR
jgi:uncharacterized DUF497 family protein